jgi:hypothetical protein
MVYILQDRKVARKCRFDFSNKKKGTYPLNNNRLDSKVFLHLRSYVSSLVGPGDVIDGHIAAFIGEFNTY